MNPVPNAVAGLLEALRAGTVRLIDLTHGLDDHSPYWPGGRDRWRGAIHAESGFSTVPLPVRDADGMAAGLRLGCYE